MLFRSVGGERFACSAVYRQLNKKRAGGRGREHGGLHCEQGANLFSGAAGAALGNPSTNGGPPNRAGRSGQNLGWQHFLVIATAVAGARVTGTGGFWKRPEGTGGQGLLLEGEGQMLLSGDAGSSCCRELEAARCQEQPGEAGGQMLLPGCEGWKLLAGKAGSSRCWGLEAVQDQEQPEEAGGQMLLPGSEIRMWLPHDEGGSCCWEPGAAGDQEQPEEARGEGAAEPPEGLAGDAAARTLAGTMLEMLPTSEKLKAQSLWNFHSRRGSDLVEFHGEPPRELSVSTAVRKSEGERLSPQEKAQSLWILTQVEAQILVRSSMLKAEVPSSEKAQSLWILTQDEAQILVRTPCFRMNPREADCECSCWEFGGMLSGGWKLPGPAKVASCCSYELKNSQCKWPQEARECNSRPADRQAQPDQDYRFLLLK